MLYFSRKKEVMDMITKEKIGISLPKQDLKRIEKVRKELGINRSELVDLAIRFWLKNFEQQKMIEKYEEGYRRKPESIEELKAMEKAAAEAFGEEDLK